MQWSVYIILCDDGSLYTGISTHVERRFQEHASLRGAKFFRHCQPVKLVFVESGHSRSSATRRESEIKSLKRLDKLKLCHSSLNEFDMTAKKVVTPSSPI